MIIKKFWKKNGSILMTFMVALALFLFISVVRPGYATSGTVNLLMISVAALGLTALGQTFPVLTGGMDLSVPWVFCIGAYMGTALSAGQDVRLLYAIPVVMVAGLIMGAFNGFGIAYIGIAPVIMTMASNIIFQGLLLGITGGTVSSGMPPFITKLALGNVFGISTLFILWLVISLIAWIILSKGVYGRKIYAVGNSETCSMYSGIRVKLVKLSAYALCSMFAALAGLLYSGKLSQLYLGMGDPYQMKSISAVAIGGVALAGGSGNYVGVMGGCFVIVVLDALLTAMNFSQGVQKIVYGIVLFVAVLVASRKKRAS